MNKLNTGKLSPNVQGIAQMKSAGLDEGRPYRTAAWILLFIGIIPWMIPLLGFFLGLVITSVLYFIALIVGIVALVKGSPTRGVILLVCNLLVFPLFCIAAQFISLSLTLASTAKENEASTMSNELNDEQLTEANENTEAINQPQEAKNPDVNQHRQRIVEEPILDTPQPQIIEPVITTPQISGVSFDTLQKAYSLEDRGFHLTKIDQSSSLKWLFSLDVEKVVYTVVIEGRSPDDIFSIEARIFRHDKKPVDPLAKHYFGVIAALGKNTPASVDAKNWVIKNTGKDSKHVIGDLNFYLLAPSSERILVITQNQ